MCYNISEEIKEKVWTPSSPYPVSVLTGFSGWSRCFVCVHWSVRQLFSRGMKGSIISTTPLPSQGKFTSWAIVAVEGSSTPCLALGQDFFLLYCTPDKSCRCKMKERVWSETTGERVVHSKSRFQSIWPSVSCWLLETWHEFWIALAWKTAVQQKTDFFLPVLFL